MSTSFEKELQAAKKVIGESRAISLSYFDKNPLSRLKADNTIVTEADEAIEAYIREKLHHEFSDIGFLGEESESDVRDATWIVDPIDGTQSFARGTTDFSTVISLKINHEVLFSFIYLPVADVLYSAIKDQGAYRNNQRIFVSNVSDISSSIIVIDRKVIQKERTKQYGLQLIDTYRVQVGPHAGVGSAHLAQGSTDVFIKFYQKIWDTAPEYLLMKEAGSVVTDEFGDELTLNFSKEAEHHYVATNPLLSKNFADTLYLTK